MTRRAPAILLALAFAVLAAGGSDDADDSTARSTTTRVPTVDTSDPAITTDLPEGDDRSVERVVDGDTIVVDGGERVRLIGIDTPESVDPRRPVECFGLEASAFMEDLLPPGTDVRLVFDVEREDRYERTLAYVYRVADGLFVNFHLVDQGYAQVATYPPNVEHTDEFVEATREAREADRGLWSAC